MALPFAPKPCAWSTKAVRRRRPSRALRIRPELLCQRQRAAQAPLPATPAEAAEMRALRRTNKRLTQEPGILEKAVAIFLHPLTL